MEDHFPFFSWLICRFQPLIFQGVVIKPKKQNMLKQSLKAEVRELDIEDDPWGMQKKIYHWRIFPCISQVLPTGMEQIMKPPFLKIPK